MPHASEMTVTTKKGTAPIKNGAMCGRAKPHPNNRRLSRESKPFKATLSKPEILVGIDWAHLVNRAGGPKTALTGASIFG
jgi:hypothetical protein